MQHIERLLADVNLPTMVAEVLLLLAVLAVIRFGKALLLAAVVGSVAGGVSLGEGNAPATAGTHAAIGFGIAATTLVLVRVAKSLVLWLLITAAGVAALLFYGFHR